ncbi:glycosyltransferase [Alienimonas californiensis]|uniref:Alpha-D-kanosaminyltransferase n=1 Tax=Alienimonas californiensis TaxID=2527989 RepID=A0A517P451_9PLAN|nr:glycosyltransferase [Alienimonas californiensis]QDT14160.1 Alpha-D-kanosaminyltransferase [Alienimonas californiensis]
MPVASPVVLHVRVVTGTGGGPEKTILNSPRLLADRGYAGLCVFLHPPGDPGIEDLRRRGRAAGTEIVAMPDRGLRDLSVVRSLVRLCREREVRIWHGHDYKSNVLGLLVRPFHRMELVTTVHGWVDKTGRMPLYTRIDKAALRFYRRILCVSPDLVEECAAAGLRRDRLELVENAIDVEANRPPTAAERAASRERLDLPEGRFVVLGVGRLNPEKAFDRLIDAVAALRADGVDAELLIAGDGAERAALQTRIDALPKPARFRLLGYRTDVNDLLAAADAFCLSSLREGLPNVVLEAMARGLPVAATAIAGVPRLIADGETGLLVPPADTPALTAALARLADDEVQRRRLGEEGRATVETRYSFAARMDRVAAAYDELVVKFRLAQPSESTEPA